MNNKCFFSIILPVYNGEEYLTDAIKSILSQTYSNFELIIVDDASTDDSLKIAKEFQSADLRIKIIENPSNLSLPKSLNIGHRSAKGEYLTWTSHDNILKPGFLASFQDEIKSNDFDILFSNYDIIDDAGSFKREHKAGSINYLLLGNYIGASFIYKKKVFKKLGGFDPNLFLVEDHDFFLRASFNFKIHHVDKNLYEYRIHKRSLTSKISDDKNFAEKLKAGLYRMYDELEIGLNKSTQDLIVGLYFKDKILNLYLENKIKIRKDFRNYENRLIHNQDKLALTQLEYLIRLNWLDHKDLQTPANLFKVFLKAPELLFRISHNYKASLTIIFLSFLKKPHE